MRKYDYLIVGSGLFGATVCQMLTKHGKSCLVLDKRSQVGGNVFTEQINGITVHKYGAHIFHTNNQVVWEYMNSFAEFNRYTNSPVAIYKGRLYNLPFNMNTFHQLWGVTTPQQACQKIEEQRKRSGIINPGNLEEQAIALVGHDVYYTLIKEYTEKQWGRKATELPPSIISRIPVRYIFDNNYFNDAYQGIPVGGYTQIINKMLEKADVLLDCDYFDERSTFNNLSSKLVFTGEIDRFFDYCYGPLEYRSLDFQTEILNGIPNYQGNAVVNYIDSEIEYTRIIEHKHFEYGTQSDTVITKEYPKEWNIGQDPFYPINDSRNNDIYSKYRELAQMQGNVYFGGRLAEYRYYNMDQIVEKAHSMASNLLKECESV